MPQEQTRQTVVALASHVPDSKVFAELFHQTMKLVEEAAEYLDGPGKQEQKKMPRELALSYVTESMRLSTRLLNLAAWVLQMRAVKEGQESLSEFRKEKTKQIIAGACKIPFSELDGLPKKLIEYIELSYEILMRIKQLDKIVQQEERTESADPVSGMMHQLRSMFESTG